MVQCENRTHDLLLLRKLVEQMNKDCKKSGPLRVRLSTEKENKTGSSQVGAISKAQKYSKNNYWKHLENYFQKKFSKFFFEKKYFFRKSHNAEKLKKRPFRLIKRFYKPKTSKKCKGLPFDRIRKFSKKSRIVPKKTKKIKRKKTFGLASTFGSIKNLWFSARIEPTISGFSEN